MVRQDKTKQEDLQTQWQQHKKSKALNISKPKNHPIFPTHTAQLN